MVNRGVTPIDSSTPVGQLRIFLGDVDSVPLNPPETGYVDYTNFSDAQLEQYITWGGGSITRATGYAYLGLGGAVIAYDGRWTTDDLTVQDSTGANYISLAEKYFGLADDEDGSSGTDYFNVVPTVKDSEVFPEASTRPVWY